VFLFNWFFLLIPQKKIKQNFVGSPEIRVTNLGQESSIIMMDKVPNCTDVIGEFFGKRQGSPNYSVVSLGFTIII
jgi:hypothetical protein